MELIKREAVNDAKHAKQSFVIGAIIVVSAIVLYSLFGSSSGDAGFVVCFLGVFAGIVIIFIVGMAFYMSYKLSTDDI
jgi:predicted permease